MVGLVEDAFVGEGGVGLDGFEDGFDVFFFAVGVFEAEGVVDGEAAVEVGVVGCGGCVDGVGVDFWGECGIIWIVLRWGDGSLKHYFDDGLARILVSLF